jgi:hypothetical protein
MKSRASSFGLGLEYDNFLFAPIAEDRNGMSLSVVSLLGRMDLDPWQEAASLAALPVEAATQRLTSLLGLLPDPPAQQPDPRSTAARLVELLPHRPDPNTGPFQASTASDGATHARSISKGIFLGIYLALMLATQLVIAHLEPTRADAAHTPAALTVPSQMPPPASVK